MTRAGRPVHLLYIVGSARSGSTLLGHLLSNHREIQDLGEVEDSNRPHRERVCTCGLSLDACPFWGRVSEILADEGLSLATIPMQERPRVPFSRVAFPSLPEILLAGSPRLLAKAGRNANVGRVLDTASKVWRIVRAAADAADASIIIDDVKRPDGALALYNTRPEGSTFRLIHLLRDGRGSTYSIMRYRDLSMREAVRYWRRRTVGSLLVYSRLPRPLRMRVRYEELCADTTGELRRICSFLGLPYEEGMEVLETGNKHRYGGSESPLLQTREVRLDERWREELGPEELRIFRRAAGPLNRLLGYR